MSLAALIALILGVSLTAYAVFAGADFGAGILDLLAGDRGEDRQAIAATIGPLWEANHVWLIFSITILFSAFPAAFSALGTSLLAPFTIALLAIVLRSSALGLRFSPGARERSQIALGRLFGTASLIAPLAFGVVAGGVAKAVDAAPPTGRSVPTIPWTSPFALMIGALAVALCAELAASFVALRLSRFGRDRDAERFRRRALQSAGSALALMVLALITAAATAPALWHRLIGVALPVVITGIAAAGASLLALASRRYPIARGATALSAAALLWGWFVAQAPRLIGTRLTLHTAAASHAALAAIAIAAGIVLLLVLPSMYLLFAVFARPVPEVAK
jgi:cytochrome bd ubiquinol oxidase subunit II